MTKKTVLIIADYYLPGYKSGGTLRTIVNMVERLQKYYNFKIITRDHDGSEDLTPYENVKINKWNQLSNANVYYISRDKINVKTIGKLISEVKPDSIYMNSCFSTLTINTLLLKKMGKLKQTSVIIAPEGELHKGALSVRSFKKKIYLRSALIVGLYKNIIWKGSSEQETVDIEQLQQKGDKIFFAPNMPPNEIFPQYKQNLKPEKTEDKVKFVFLSRFARVKNFNWFLETIKELKSEIHIDIYAPIAEESYWEECKKIISELPKNFNINYKGLLPYDEVVKTLFNYHFFVLPTLGESFGHVFLEALSAGCPLLTSDQTPWTNLSEKNIGWDLPLDKPEIWREKVKKCIEMGNEEFKSMSVSSREYAEAWLNDSKQEEATNNVLEFAVNVAI